MTVRRLCAPQRLWASEMFDYPIPLIQGGLYAKLGLSPAATADETNDARKALTFQLRADLRSVQLGLDAVYRALPGLKASLDQVDSLLEAGAGLDPQALRQAQAKADSLLTRARAVRSDFESLRERAAGLERDISEANVIAIQLPEERKKYDREHPPFEILKLEDCSASPLDDRRTMLSAIRDEL